MARYADIDTILNELSDDLPYKASVKRVLMQAPEADVVPRAEAENYKSIAEYQQKLSIDRYFEIKQLKQELDKAKSEVEELKAIIKDHQANEERWQELYADTVNKWEKAYEELEIELENAKSEVAREIFEEIEESIAVHAYTSKSEDYADGMLAAIEWVDSKISELKKKYTEGEK